MPLPGLVGLPARWAFIWFLEDYEQRWHKKALVWVVRASAELEVTYKWCRLTGSGVGSPGALDLSRAAACSTCGTHLCLCWAGLVVYRHCHSRAVLQEGWLSAACAFQLQQKKKEEDQNMVVSWKRIDIPFLMFASSKETLYI